MTEELLAGAGTFSGLNIFTTLVRNRKLFAPWVSYGTAMLYGRLPARDRELLILRTAHRCGSYYEWGQHVTISIKSIGMSPAEVARVQEGPDAPGWSPFDAALIRSVDEMLDDHRIGDSTWQVLAQRYDETLLVELPLVVGHYYAVALTLNSLGVELDFEDPSKLL